MPLSKKQKSYIGKHYRRHISVKEISAKVRANPAEVAEYLEASSLTIDPKKRVIYNLIALSIPIVFFVFLEIGLQIFKYGGELSLFVTAPDEYSKFKMCNPYIGRRYFALQTSYPDPSRDFFLIEKPDDCFRIFVLGGSTAAGYPYSENLMFSRILHRRLEDVFPEKRIEMVNTATAAINSYTLLDFMDEILENQPDAILIYAGHNEFYGALGVASTETLGKFRWLIRLYLKLKDYRTFLLVRDFITKVQIWIGGVFGSDSVEDPTATLMERLVGEQKIVYGDGIYELGKKQFGENLRAILEKTTNAGVEVVTSELISNIKDQKPFESVTAFNLPPADEVYETARNLEKEGKNEEAYEKYYLAKDLDALRFRASEEFNEIIHQVSSEFGVPVVPLKSIFEAASPNRLIGHNLTLEHLHPNIDGYFLIADAFFNSLRNNELISSEWNAERIKPASYYRESWGYTELDSLYGDLRIRILKGGWPFKPKAAPNRAMIDYYPTTRAESLVVKIIVDKKFSLERGHVEMADFYEKRKEYLPAYKEFYALVCLTPDNISPYLGAANALVKARDLDRALPILYRSLKVEETAFAHKWIGQILLDDGFVQKSLPHLTKAYEMNSQDPQVLYNLSGAYALSAQYEKAKETLNQLYAINPNFPDANVLKRQLDRILKN